MAVVSVIAATAIHPGPRPGQPFGLPGAETYGRRFCELSYLRPERAGHSVRLGVERRSVAPGQNAYARLETRAASDVYFGEEFGVERFASGRWRSVPLFPGRRREELEWLDAGFVMPSGETGYCTRYRVPRGTPPGRYRFTRKVWVGGPEGKETLLTRQFRVRR